MTHYIAANRSLSGKSVVMAVRRSGELKRTVLYSLSWHRLVPDATVRPWLALTNRVNSAIVL